MTEADLQRAVISLAKLHGWRVAHFRPAMNRSGRWQTAVAADGAGFPDLVLVGHGQVLFRELKAGKGSLAPEQVAWSAALAGNGADWSVWSERDWPAVIAEQLGAKVAA